MSDATPRNFPTGDQHAAQTAPPKGYGLEHFLRNMNDAQALLVSGGKSLSSFGSDAAESFPKESQVSYLDTSPGDIYNSHFQTAA